MSIEKIEKAIKGFENDIKMFNEKEPFKSQSAKYRRQVEKNLKRAKMELDKIYIAYHKAKELEDKTIDWLDNLL